MLIKNNSCLCGSTRHYNKCCGIFHNNNLAPTAEALMRSRYTAFCMNKTSYLVTTTLPEQQKMLLANNTYKASNQTKWFKLEIIATKNGKQQDQTGIVEFKAWYTDIASGLKHCHHEISSFIKQSNHWYFVYPE
jgi:SEC-C motif-containing protein